MLAPAAGRRPWLRLALVASVAAGLCLLWWTGGLADLAEPERARAALADSGWFGPLVFCLAFACLQPFGVPGAAFMIPASLVWTPAVAVALVVAGATGAGVVALALARWIGPETLVARLPEPVRRRTARARERPFRTALVVRLVLFLFPPAHWALGASGIRLAPLVLGSALGFLPAATLWVLATREIAGRLERLPLWEAAGLGVAGLALAAGFVLWRRRRGSGGATSPP